MMTTNELARRRRQMQRRTRVVLAQRRVAGIGVSGQGSVGGDEPASQDVDPGDNLGSLHSLVA